MRRTIITLAAGIATGVAAVSAPALGSHQAAKRDLTMRTGDNLGIPTLDVFCHLYLHDPDGHVTGPVIFCARNSEVNGSWGVMVSRRWIKVLNPQGYYVWQHARLP
jgi:hypothetical protein